MSNPLSHEHGVGCVALANANHWMRGGSYGWQAADAGVIGICWTDKLPILPPWRTSDPPGRLVAGFTFSDPGNWTSWPPHEHAKMLEEMYGYFNMPEPAFGIQLVYNNTECLEPWCAAATPS